jgi:hypothetical protein
LADRRHRIIACASTSSLAGYPAPPESIGSTAKSPRPWARITGSIVSARVGGEDRTPFCTGRSCRSSASHEVCVPSAHPAASALSRAAGLWTIPLRPWLTSRPRASRTIVEDSTGPCGLSLRGSNAVLLDVGTTGEVYDCKGAAWPRRLNESSHLRVRHHRSVAPARSGEPIHALASDPTTSSAAALLPWLAFRVMHQVLSWHGVPLPASSRRGLAGRMGPSLCCFARQRSWDFLTPFAGLFPPRGESASLPIPSHLSV